jgi:hypothetical protein
MGWMVVIIHSRYKIENYSIIPDLFPFSMKENKNSFIELTSFSY